MGGLRIGGGRALAALRGRRLPPLEEARRSAMLGQALGEAAGAFAYRVPPPSRLAAPPDLQPDLQPARKSARKSARPAARHG
jgi:hypothetical protein